MKKVVVFTQDFAGKEKGDEYTCDSMLASSLVNNRKVAKYKTAAKKKKKEEK